MAHSPSPLLIEAIRILARVGLSKSQAAVVLGMPKGSLITRARIAGITFNGPRKIGPGCTSEQARKGWETRRARAWVWTRPVPAVPRSPQ